MTAQQSTEGKGTSKSATKQAAAKAAAKQIPVKQTATKQVATKQVAKQGTTSKQVASKQTATAKKAPPRYYPQQLPTPDRYKEIQDALANKGYFAGPSDGTWGPSSVDALKHFQHDQSLNEDGKLDSLSLIALGLGPNRK